MVRFNSQKKRNLKSRTSQDKRQAFVIMPFKHKGSDEHKHFKTIYQEHIKPTLENCGFNSLRADEINQPGAITKDLVEYLSTADLVIADLTEGSANVFYELGIRHSLFEAGTILIQDELKTPQTPFDLSGHRVIKFQGNLHGLPLLKNELEQYIKDLFNSKKKIIDSPVYDCIPDIKTRQLFLLNTNKKKQNRESNNEELLNPEEVIRMALDEAENDLLPKTLIKEAYDAVSDENMSRFLEIILEILDVEIFQPSVNEFSELYLLSERMDARKVSRALLNIGLKIFPDNLRLRKLHMIDLAHSTDQADRTTAKQLISERLNIEIKEKDINIDTLDNVGEQDDLLYIMLDAYHRDGKDDEALRIASELKKKFPQKSITLRNYARALEKKGQASIKEITNAYRDAVICENTDDSSARWYAATLLESGEIVDAVEAILLACLLDLDEAKCFAMLALFLSEIVQPQNFFRFNNMKRKLPDEYKNESYITKSILISMSCGNFGVEEKSICERAMRNLGLSDEEIEEGINEQEEQEEYSRRDRQEFILPFYEQLKSYITVADDKKQESLNGKFSSGENLVSPT